MSEQPVILPTSSRASARYSKRFTVRNLAILAVSLLILLVLLNVLVATFNKPEEPVAAPVTVTATSEPTSTPEPTPTATSAPSLYDDCAAVWSALNRPIFKEDEGYRELFDWDANGVGCEDNPATPEDESTVDWGAVRERFRENLEDLGETVGPKAEDFYKDARDFLQN
jgi:hypothetical protein